MKQARNHLSMQSNETAGLLRLKLKCTMLYKMQYWHNQTPAQSSNKTEQLARILANLHSWLRMSCTHSYVAMLYHS